MTLATMLADLYRRARYSASPPADVTTRLTAFINETQQELAEDPRLASLIRGEWTFTTTANRAEYGVPPNISRIVTMRDTTNRYPLVPQSLSWYRSAIPNQTVQTGTPTSYVELGFKPITLQPAAATGLWMASSDATDTTQSALVEVVRTGGYLYAPPSAQLNGTTRVQFGTLTDYVEIHDWYFIATVPVGDVSLFDASSGGNVLGVIPRGTTRSTSSWIGLAPTPSASLSYAIDYERRITDLTVATDEPYWLPLAFHRLIVTGARRKEYEYLGDQRLSIATDEWGNGLLKLITFVNNPPGRVLVPGASTSGGRSDLGAWYPSGTIWNG